MQGNFLRQLSSMTVRQSIRSEPPADTAGTAGSVSCYPFLFIYVCTEEYIIFILFPLHFAFATALGVPLSRLAVLMFEAAKGLSLQAWRQ